MFYVKEAINDSMEVAIKINDENVFGHCPVCGKEIPVDLESVLKEGDGDLFGTAVLCDECAKEWMKKHGKESET